MRKGIRRNWKQILCIVLIFVSVLGIVGIGFIFDRPGGGIKDGNDGSDAGVTTPGGSNTGGEEMPTGSKSGLYKNESGTLTYTYPGADYTKLLNSELGFDLGYEVDRTVIGADPETSDRWATVMYDRGFDPYLFVGKDADSIRMTAIFSPETYEGSKMIFETDFAWLGSKGAGADCSDPNPTWNASLLLCPPGTSNMEYISIRFREYQDNVFYMDVNNKMYDVGFFNIGEWYNLRIEITPLNSTDEAKYEVYIDNILRVEFVGSAFKSPLNPKSWETQLSVRKNSLSGGFYLDNTYVSNK